MKNKKSNNLLSNRYKPFSVIFITLGITFLSAYLNGIKPDFLNVKVFALASTYLEKRFVQVVQTNAMDEVGMSMLVAGLFLLILTKEKKENEQTNHNRLQAFVFAAKATFVFWIGCYWLFFGYIIFPISMTFFVFYLLVYYFFFKYLNWISDKTIVNKF